MRRLSSLQEEVELWNTLAQRVRDAMELAALEDEGLSDELAVETGALEQEIEKLEFQLLFSGSHVLTSINNIVYQLLILFKNRYCQILWW